MRAALAAVRTFDPWAKAAPRERHARAERVGAAVGTAARRLAPREFRNLGRAEARVREAEKPRAGRGLESLGAIPGLGGMRQLARSYATAVLAHAGPER